MYFYFVEALLCLSHMSPLLNSNEVFVTSNFSNQSSTAMLNKSLLSVENDYCCVISLTRRLTCYLPERYVLSRSGHNKLISEHKFLGRVLVVIIMHIGVT